MVSGVQSNLLVSNILVTFTQDDIIVLVNIRNVLFYATTILALSQDENEMGRFLRDQGATDKTKAGKMMIAVGKAQSYAAQQRLGYKLWAKNKNLF